MSLAFVAFLVICTWFVLLGTWRLVVRLFEQEPGDYTEDWPKISKAHKIRVKWKCQKCRVDLSRHHVLMHVHHRNRRRNDNRERNLMALCVECHSKMDGVGHRRLAGAIRTDGRLARLKKVRNGQRWFFCRWIGWLGY